jgi:hypothetical protein
MPEIVPTYELFAVRLGDTAPAHEYVGCYATFEAALVARDEHVLAQLEAGGGWYRVVEHAIIGPGRNGPHTVHANATALGVDPATGHAPTQEDLEDARRWLKTIHTG